MSECFSQNGSFQVILDSTEFRMQDVAVNENDKVILFMRRYPNTVKTGFFILPIENTGGATQGIEIPINPANVIRTEYHQNIATFIAWGAPYYLSSTQLIGKTIIFNIDLASNVKWSKYLNGRILQNKFSIDNEGNIILVNTPQSLFLDDLYDGHTSVLEVFKLDESGNTIWKNGTLILDSLFYEFPNVLIMDMALDDASNIYVLGLCGNLTGPNDFIFPYIIKFDSNGNPLIIKALTEPGQYFYEIEITSDGIFVLSHASNNPDLYGAGAFQKKYAKLLKLDFDLNLLWGKKYSGENFPYYSAGIKEKPDGNLLMTHATFGAFPVVLTELDDNGNIITEKGFPNYQPQVVPFDDGSFLMTSEINYNDVGETSYQPVIARTNTSGEIEGCEFYPACISAEDYTIEMGAFNFDTVSIPDLEDFDTTVTPVTFSFSEFCGFPPAPQPDFDFPDSLCLGDTGITSNTRNQFANAREWRLSGPGVDSVLADSFNFSFTFEQPGEYLLTQTVWVLGCAYPYERVITVMPPLEAAIFPKHICPDIPDTIFVETNRPGYSFTWSNGQPTPSLSVQTGGTYAVTVSDGACTASDTAEITLVDELFGGLPALNLPPDTMICFTDLPFTLTPASAFTDTFFLQTDLKPAQSFQLEEAGHYRIGASVFGCTIWEDFNLEVDCHADVYVPNAFSPNGDGINDLFRPYGTDFEVLEMVIYDRWGGERYRSKGQSAAWDGGGAGQGVFTYRLKYLDKLNGREKELTGEVALIK